MASNPHTAYRRVGTAAVAERMSRQKLYRNTGTHLRLQTFIVIHLFEVLVVCPQQRNVGAGWVLLHFFVVVEF